MTGVFVSTDSEALFDSSSWAHNRVISLYGQKAPLPKAAAPTTAFILSLQRASSAE